MMFIIVLINVIMRYFLNTSLMWSIEISLFLFISIIFIGAASATVSKDYMQVDLFVKKYSGKIFILYELLVNISILIFGIVAFIGCVKIIPKTWNTIPSGVIMWYRSAYVYFVMAFAFLFISTFASCQIIRSLNKYRMKK